MCAPFKLFGVDTVHIDSTVRHSIDCGFTQRCKYCYDSDIVIEEVARKVELR